MDDKEFYQCECGEKITFPLPHYCKKCGAILPGSEDYISEVQSMHMKNHSSRNTIIKLCSAFISLIFIMAAFNVHLYKELNICKGKYEHLDSEYKNLKQEMKEASNSNGTTGTLKDYIMKNYGNKSSDTEEETYVYRDPSAAYPKIKNSYELHPKEEEKDTFKNIPDVEEKEKITCTIPSCDKTPERNSLFCSSHECDEVSCHNKRANDLCFYCTEHKCMKPNCNFQKAYNNNYCYVHKKD